MKVTRAQALLGFSGRNETVRISKEGEKAEAVHSQLFGSEQRDALNREMLKDPEWAEPTNLELGKTEAVLLAIVICNCFLLAKLLHKA